MATRSDPRSSVVNGAGNGARPTGNRSAGRVLDTIDLFLAQENVNWVFGDGASGAASLGQSLALRPRPELAGYGTEIRRLFQIGASVHPGGGLGAGSGYAVAKRLAGAR